MTVEVEIVVGEQVTALAMGTGRMTTCMLDVRQHLEILDPVVLRIFVEMMDILISRQESAEMLFHDEPMLEDVPLLIGSWMFRRSDQNVRTVPTPDRTTTFPVWGSRTSPL